MPARTKLEQLARYPERESVELALAEFFRVRPEELLLHKRCGRGHHLICATYLEPDDQAVIVVTNVWHLRVVRRGRRREAGFSSCQQNSSFLHKMLVAALMTAPVGMIRESQQSNRPG